MSARRTTALLTTVLALAAWAAPARAASRPAPFAPGKVVVKFKPGVSPAEQRAIQAAANVQPIGAPPAPRTAEVQITDDEGVRSTVRELEADPRVVYAVPNYIAHASGSFIPNDPGHGGPGDWRLKQWNFLPADGIDAPGAWTKRGQDYAARDPEGFAKAMAARPIGRLGDPETDIAPVAVFLASDDSRFVTGHVFYVDGGAHLG